MMQRAGLNARFREKLLQLDSYPLFLTLDPSASMAMANGGQPMQAGDAPKEMSDKKPEEELQEKQNPDAMPQGDPVQ